MAQLRHMLRDDDVNHEEQKQILELGMKFRENRFHHRPFEGPQGVAVLFDKPSTRTRSSFSGRGLWPPAIMVYSENMQLSQQRKRTPSLRRMSWLMSKQWHVGHT